MIFKAIICMVKGHDINPDESIVGHIMLDKRNWLCRCHRCGLYVMNDGAISNSSITISERQAMKTKRDFERDFMEIVRRLHEREHEEWMI